MTALPDWIKKTPGPASLHDAIAIAWIALGKIDSACAPSVNMITALKAMLRIEALGKK